MLCTTLLKFYIYEAISVINLYKKRLKIIFFKNVNKTFSSPFWFKAFTGSVKLHFIADGIALLIVLVCFMSYYVLWIVNTK